MKSPRILLVDDHAMFRSGLALLIRAAMPDAHIHECASVQEASAAVLDGVDVVLLDIHLQGLSGLEGIDLMHRRWPDAPVLMLSSQSEPETVRLAIARGAAGFVSKAETADDIVKAIDRALHGNSAAPAASPDAQGERRLTPRQCEVLDLLSQGMSNKVLARQLSLSDNTVRRHVQDILMFFDVGSRAEAVAAARRQRLIG
ncbi:MAG: DNA-binding response regulator [Burkholderiales bacterium PBB6]|jgi:DNA-binding NarL/FixJ family response regulator|nr:MAG: DNA-binding response regulator [Burkholderiales bacterium PBB6]